MHFYCFLLNNEIITMKKNTMSHYKKLNKTKHYIEYLKIIIFYTKLLKITTSITNVYFFI